MPTDLTAGAPAATDPAVDPATGGERRGLLFWACFVALIATAFGFVTRAELLDDWALQFGLNDYQKGQISGVGLWPFAISIVLMSLVVDKIGYGKAMVLAFAAHLIYAVTVICAPLVLAEPGASEADVLAGKQAGFWMLYVGNFIFALGNGTVEAVVNPVVASMFTREKTKRLNMLHAGWPGGLVLAGLIGIGLGADFDWRVKVALIVPVALTYGGMMAMCKFPVSERVAAGGSYRGMLAEFGALGALICTALIGRELIGGVLATVLRDTDPGANNDALDTALLAAQIALPLVVAGAFFAYTRSLGRPGFIFLLCLMVPLATTELGTDGWIVELMTPPMVQLGLNALWVLIYTSAIMLVLRFFAGPIVHKISPLGLLAVSSVLAIMGLIFLSRAAGIGILLAATVYGFGKTFFWPTMLGVVAEQYPRGGALTLNATGGVGMLGVGVLGAPLIGLIQENAVRNDVPDALYAQVSTTAEGVYGEYEAADADKVAALPAEERAVFTEAADGAKKGALATMAIFPTIMLLAYLGLIFYFKSRGGYRAVELTEGPQTEEEAAARYGGGLATAIE